MVEATVAEVVGRGARRAGVLTLGGPDSVTTELTRRAAAIYVDPLEARGITCETIWPELQLELNRGIFAVMAGRAGDEDRAALDRALSELRRRGTDCIVLGCTELPFLVTESNGGPDLVDPIALLAEAAVRHAMS
jgi:aspartate racemase